MLRRTFLARLPLSLDLNADLAKQSSETGVALENTAHAMHALVERFKEK